MGKAVFTLFTVKYFQKKPGVAAWEISPERRTGKEQALEIDSQSLLLSKPVLLCIKRRTGRQFTQSRIGPQFYQNLERMIPGRLCHGRLPDGLLWPAIRCEETDDRNPAQDQQNYFFSKAIHANPIKLSPCQDGDWPENVLGWLANGWERGRFFASHILEKEASNECKGVFVRIAKARKADCQLSVVGRPIQI
jgi:hypothetical protein